MILFSGGSVDNAGLIKSFGTSADGIAMYTSNSFVRNERYGVINGGRTGDGVRLNNGGSVANYGLIKTGVSGVRGVGVYMYNGGSVSNKGSLATIEGQFGIQSKNTPANIYNSGTIIGYRSGIDLQNGGNVYNDNSRYCCGSFAGLGTITGIQKGINIAGTLGHVRNYGLITGGSVGVDMQAGGYLKNNSSYSTPGVISGGSFGVRITGGTYGVVFNDRYEGTRATITGGSIGVELASNFNLLGNSGVITGGSVGVQIGYSRNTAANVGIVNNADSGYIGGGHYGVALYGSGRFGSGSVANFGTIISAGTNGAGVYLAEGGSVNNGASAAVIAGDYGIKSQYGYASVTNQGSIMGGTYGVALFGGGYVSNASTGTISGNIGVGIGYVNNTVAYTGSVLNSGKILGGHYGVALFGGGYVSNAASGFIGGESGVQVGYFNNTIAFAGTVLNSGSITGIDGIASMAAAMSATHPPALSELSFLVCMAVRWLA